MGVVMQEENLKEKEGGLFAIQGSDGRWHGGKVICKGSAKSVVKVALIDSGHLLVLPPWQAGQGRLDMQPLNKRFCKLPIGVIQAKLVGVSPKQITWSGDAREWWRGTVLNKCFNCQVKKVMEMAGEESTSLIEVELVEMREEGRRHIGMEMIEIGFASLN